MKSFLLLSLLALSLVGCNAFQGLDQPITDEQKLAAARACLDQSDFTCAVTYYNQVSSASNDTKYTELAFESLTKNGLPATTLSQALISGFSSIGDLITNLANEISSNSTPGLSARLDIFHAYKDSQNYITSTKVKGIVGFLTSLALLSEILAEASATRGHLKRSDLVSTPSTCLSAGAGSAPNFFPNCAGAASVIKTGTLTTPFFTLKTATDSQLTGTGNSPTLEMIMSVNDAITSALGTFSGSGSLSSGSLSFSNSLINQLTTYSGAAADRAIRYFLINQGIGAAL